jgi:capsular exopolysaccharide synthesis family protein
MKERAAARRSTGIQELVIFSEPGSAAAEAYRTLRANIQLRGGQLNGSSGATKMVLFTSSAPEDAKSTAIANIGVAAAQAGSRALLIDADLRHPRLHEIFGLPNTEGLGTALASGNVDDVVPQQTSINGLQVLTSGPSPSNPVDLLSSPSMATLLRGLAQDADLIMLDSPPAGALADASVLASRVDGVVLVIDARRTHREQAQRAKAQLERVHANIWGVVLTGARLDPRAYQY